MFIRGDV